MAWTWDPNKNRENIQKRRIRSETAMLVFDDLRNATREDEKNLKL
jgi:uncharacterized DUF497 family protein